MPVWPFINSRGQAPPFSFEEMALLGGLTSGTASVPERGKYEKKRLKPVVLAVLAERMCWLFCSLIRTNFCIEKSNTQGGLAMRKPFGESFMIQVRRLLTLLAVSCMLLSVPSTAKPQKVVFPEGCLSCHGAEPKYPVRGARAQYMTSGHKTIGNASYANAPVCQKCHTNEGFIEYAKTGKVDPKAFIPNPSEIGCFTCHDPHVTGDFSLRKADVVKLANGATFDKAESNLCANCHQARRSSKKEVTERKISSSHWGPHHGPQADMLLGTNGYEFPGKQYSKSVHSLLPNANCVSCHMAQPTGRYRLSPVVGGHSFSVEGEVHEAPKLNAAGCLGSGCHKKMKQVKGSLSFKRKATADYDGNGTIDNIQEEVQGLYERLINDEGTGLLQTMKDPLYNPKGGFIKTKVTYPVEVVAALYNYKFVQEDRSRGIHNTRYAVQLLMDSIKALDPKFDNSKRP
jgi:hypothetical protein